MDKNNRERERVEKLEIDKCTQANSLDRMNQGRMK